MTSIDLRLGWVVLGLAVVVAACDGQGVHPDVPPCASCRLHDEHCFRMDSQLDVPVFRLAEGRDTLLDWSGLTQDILGRSIDPVRDVSAAWLVVFQGISTEEIAAGLATDSLAQSEVSVFLSCTPAQASCAISDFAFMGTHTDVLRYFTGEWGGAWLLALVDPGEQGARGLAFLEPTGDEVTAVVSVSHPAANLTYDVDLASLQPVDVIPHLPILEMDWSALTRSGLGADLDIHRVDRLVVARYSADLDTLAERFAELEGLADETWEADVTGRTSQDLSQMVGDRPFPGIDESHRWLLGLFCSTCNNPAPLFLTELRADW